MVQGVGFRAPLNTWAACLFRLYMVYAFYHRVHLNAVRTDFVQ